MSYHAIQAPATQGAPSLATTLRRRLVQFLRPVSERLATKLDIRLVQTALDLVQAILTHRHGRLSLLLSELGGYLLGPAQAPAAIGAQSTLANRAATRPPSAIEKFGMTHAPNDERCAQIALDSNWMRTSADVYEYCSSLLSACAPGAARRLRALLS